MSLAIRIVSLLIILSSLFVYYKQIIRSKKQNTGDQVIAQSSQITMSAFMLGLGVLLFELNANRPSAPKMVDHLLVYGAFVSLVTIISIEYYKRTIED